MGYRAECEKNARAFYLKRKCICDKTQVRFTSNARAFDSKRKGVFGEFRKGNHDGLSGLAGIFIKCIYAGCGTKPVPTPTTRQAVARGRPVLHYRSVSFVRGAWMPWLDLIRSKSVVSERKKSRSSSSCFCGSAASSRWYTARMRPRNVRSVRSPF